MGGATVLCEHSIISDKHFTAKCYDGLLSADKATFGVLSTALDKQTYCRNEAVFVNPTNKNKANCTKFIDHTKI
jgi:hypothetical protein